MANEKPDRGPSFTWTFPLVRRFQARDGILSLGAKVISNNRLQSSDESTDKSYENSESSETENDSKSQNDVLDEIEDSIDNLKDDDIDFSQDGEGETVTIQITEDGFEPEEVDVNTGDTVKWINQTDTQSKISSINENELRSDMLDPGDEYEETLYANVEIEYRDSISSNENTGTVTVGDPDSEIDVNPIPLTENESDDTRSMSQAANDKTDLDIGF